MHSKQRFQTIPNAGFLLYSQNPSWEKFKGYFLPCYWTTEDITVLWQSSIHHDSQTDFDA